MKVTVVGAGNMGHSIATRVLAGGHEVEIVDRDAEHGFLHIAIQQPLDLGFASAIKLHP